MALETPRLKLVKPDTSELADINVLNNNFDKIDVSPGITFCTSATRPGAPYVGQRIFETDTFRSYIYIGTAWEQIGWPQAEAVTENTQTGSSWTADHIVYRIGPKLGFYVCTFWRTSTTSSITARAVLADTGLKPNEHLPDWAKIPVGGLLHTTTAMYDGIVSGDGMNTQFHWTLSGNPPSVHYRTQASFSATTSVRFTCNPIPVEIVGS